MREAPPHSALETLREPQGERNPRHWGEFLPTQERRSLDGQGEVVYQAGLAYLDGQEREGAVLDCGEVFEGLRVSDGCVVEAGQGLLADDAGHLGLDPGAGELALAAEGLGGAEGFPEDGCGPALVGGPGRRFCC